MKKIIDKQYIRDNVAQLMLGTSDSEIVMDASEILLLKVDGKVLINKYLNHPRREEFPYSDVPMHESDGAELYNILFEMDKDYLIYELGGADNIIMNRFAMKDYGCLWSYEEAEIPDEDDFEVNSYTREEMEKIFDCQNYDSMVILDRRGRIMIAYSSKDGKIVTTDMLPTVEQEKENEGKSVLLYGGFTMEHTMITSKDGILRAINFSLALDRDGTYVMDTQDITLPNVGSLEHSNEDISAYERTRDVSIR